MTIVSKKRNINSRSKNRNKHMRSKTNKNKTKYSVSKKQRGGTVSTPEDKQLNRSDLGYKRFGSDVKHAIQSIGTPNLEKKKLTAHMDILFDKLNEKGSSTYDLKKNMIRNFIQIQS